MEQDDLMARAAWLYHVESLTQAEIATRLNVTRRRVNEMLAAALRNGVVTVSFNSELSDCVALEAGLRQRFGLDDAVVIPAPADPSQMHAILGRAAAGYLDRFIQVRRPRAIGVGWGATLRETVHFLSPANLPDIEIHSMMGGLTHGSEINTFEIVRGFARVLSAQCRYLVAPIYAETPESREAIVSQAVFRRTLQDICNVDLACLSVGDVSDLSLQVRYGLPDGVTAGQLESKGAVGDLTGRYLDATGAEIDHRINRQVLAPELEQFRNIPNRIVVGGGTHKIGIVRAVASAGLATVIVTDDVNARALLDNA